MRLYACALIFAAGIAAAQTSTNCPQGTTTNGGCNVANQGDFNASSSATNTQSSVSQSGTSSASNASGVNVIPKVKTTVDATNNASASATGNTNRADGGTGGQGGNSGGNRISTGGSTSSLVGGSQSTTASGGAGGKSSSTGGVSNSGSTAGGGSGTGGAISTTTANSGNTTANTLFIPPVVPTTPPSTLAIGEIVKETSACGPLVGIIKEAVSGVVSGLFRSKRIQQGWTYQQVPVLNIDGTVKYYDDVPLTDGRDGFARFGSQVVQTTALVGTASGKNLAGGGGGGNAWGQAGIGSTQSMQQMVTGLQVRSCEVGVFIHQAPPLPPEIIHDQVIVHDVAPFVPAPKAITPHKKKRVVPACPVMEK